MIISSTENTKTKFRYLHNAQDSNGVMNKLEPYLLC